MMVSLLWRLDGSFRIKECPAEGKADCVIFFQEIESNLRSMEVQFGYFTALLLRENHNFPSSGFQNKTPFLFETRQPRTHVRVLG